MPRLKRIVAWGLFALVLMLLSGWLLADRFTPRAVGTPGHALAVQPAQTALDREIAPLIDRHAGKTGAMLIPEGLDAFAARALSARQAGRSLDLQYYIWHDDLTGRLLAREAWLAAQRGVRVRMLLDDMNGEGNDAGLMALDADPNIEIRLYNPFRNRTGLWRVLELMQRLYSVNHRMHNKAWIADNRVAVVGGRNIGEEYFDASSTSNFRDLDMLLFGPKVADVSAEFDTYWNSQAVVPIDALTSEHRRDLDAVIRSVHDEARGPDARYYFARMDNSPTVRGYASQRLQPVWTNGIRIVADPPLKWKQKADAPPAEWLVSQLQAVLRGTQRKALLISPYFVPGDDATDALVDLVKRRGAFVGIVTNSLAANDVPAVHSGYAKYRGRLLDGGVHLYELRAQAPAIEHQLMEPVRGDSAAQQRSTTKPSNRHANAEAPSGLFGSSSASLHTKAFVVDHARGFIGSFNLDPRSAYLNTEMGVLFDDPQLAAALRTQYARLANPQLSYWVSRGTNGDLRWLDQATMPPTLLHREPDASGLKRATAKVLGWLPIESQL